MLFGDYDHKIDAKKNKADLNNCSLTIVPTFSDAFKSIRELVLSDNEISVLSKELRQLEGLKILDLSRNKLVSVEKTLLPPKLVELNLSFNATLVEIQSLPSNLDVLNISSVPNLGYPPASSRSGELLKGRHLKKLKKWMADNSVQPVYRIYPKDDDASIFIDISTGLEEDVVVNSKPMEDRSSIYFALNPKCKFSQSSYVRAVNGVFCGVYDGHLGHFAADYATQKLEPRLKKAGLFNGENSMNADKIMSQCILEMDNELCDLLQKDNMHDGATCSTCFIGSDGRVTVCWLGDSRVVLGRKDDTCKALTVDHKPDDPKELKEIEKNGGKVIEKGVPRVNGILAMSRSLGDVRLKRPKMVVSNKCETSTFTITPGVDTWIIMASDGLWDVCSNSLAVRTANSAKNADEAASKLMRIAKLNGTTDNTLIRCIRLDSKSLDQKKK